MTARAFLAHLKEHVDKTRLPITKVDFHDYQYGDCSTRMVRFSILQQAMKSFAPAPDPSRAKAHLLELVREDDAMDRAVGALIGLAAGDAVGHPLEFVPADDTLPPFTLRDPRKTDSKGRDAFLELSVDANGNHVYADEYNKFRLLRGQWTDDCSMALCIADSLLSCGTFIGGDVRARYHHWWWHGYNNASRFEAKPRGSCGLGGNISKSLEELEDKYVGKRGEEISAHFDSSGEDAGNGSIMRLAPVPIRYHANMKEAQRVAVEQSYGTHPGNDAAACCRFLTYVVVRGIHRDMEKTGTMSARTWLDMIVEEFLREHKMDADSGMVKLNKLLTCAPPSPKEAVWAWREKQMLIRATLQARGPRYNGYPVSPGYFGAYCMDGLAMALWGFYYSVSFSDCIVKIVNLLGDADTTGAIGGQMAGAFYGYSSLASDPMGKAMVSNMERWDPFNEMAIRAAMLYVDGAAEAKTA